MKQNRPLIESKFFVHGMHCASCELLIEKRLIKEDSVEMVDARLSDNIVLVRHQKGDKISPSYLTKLFASDGYQFSYNAGKLSKHYQNTTNCTVPQNNTSSLFFAGLIIISFLLLNRTGFASLVSVGTGSALPLFLIFGLLAGFSTCAALVGGIILSVSKQWVSEYGNSDSTITKLQPHFLFNSGRVFGYAIFGALLGVVGNFFKLSPLLTASLVIFVSAIMVILGLQMLGVRALAKFQIRLPKSLTGGLTDESNFKGRLAPMLMGALTFFLPCGFTVTAQAIALASGTPLLGGLIMGFFALGTVPGLLAIGYSSVKLQSNPSTAGRYSAIAGYLVLFFALYNMNNQFSVLGLPNFSSLFTTTPPTAEAAPANLPALVDGKQLIKMQASAGGFAPNHFTIKAGTPVSWQVTATANAGCASTLVARGLFSDLLELPPNVPVTKEFIATTAGTYRFSCGMGMYTGSFDVIN